MTIFLDFKKMKSERTFKEFSKDVETLHNELIVLLEKQKSSVQGAALEILLSTVVAQVFLSLTDTEEELQKKIKEYGLRMENSLRVLTDEFREKK